MPLSKKLSKNYQKAHRSLTFSIEFLLCVLLDSFAFKAMVFELVPSPETSLIRRNSDISKWETAHNTEQ